MTKEKRNGEYFIGQTQSKTRLRRGILTSDVDRKVFVVLTAVFIVMLGVGIIGPILPRYARSFGVSYSIAGLTISGFGIARILFDVPCGFLCDRFGRRPIIIIGMLVYSFAGLPAAYASSIVHLILSRFIQGAGAAMFTTSAMAYVADLSPTDKRGKYLGYYQGTFFLGTAVGPALGGLLTGVGGIRMPFLLLSALALLGAGFVYGSLPELHLDLSQHSIRRISISSVISGMLSTRVAILANLSAAVTFLVTSGIRFTAIPIFGQGSLGLDDFEIGVILSVSALLTFLLVKWSGALVDKIGGLASLFYGFLSSGIIVALFALTRDFASMLVVGGILGASISLLVPAQAALAVDVSNPNHRGLSLGIYRIFSDIGIITGPIIAGVASDTFALSFSFYVIAGICIATAATIAVAGGIKKKNFHSYKRTNSG